MSTKILYLFFFGTLLLLNTSCGAKKKLVYFQASQESDSITDGQTMKNTTFEVGDIVSVIVTCADNELAEPFNLTSVARQTSVIGGYDNGVPMPGYLVFQDSTISLPILGRVKAVGLTREELAVNVENSLTQYLKDPVVSVQLQNFKITVLGEVASPGSYKIPNERVTIVEALGLAGDLKITGKRNNVLVIRHEDGKKKEYRVDLTKNDLFTSDVYFLKQNDVIYVEPNWKSRFESSPMNSTTGIIVSFTTLAISTISIIIANK